MVPSHFTGAIPLSQWFHGVSIVEAQEPSVGSVMESQGISDAMRDVFVRINPASLEFCPITIVHWENFTVQIQQGNE